MKKIGIVGLGNISSIYLENITNLFGNLSLYAVSDLRDDRCREINEKYGAKIMSTKELINCNEVDIVLNLTTPEVHSKINKMAVSANKSVYTEKPFAVDMKEAKEVLDIAKKNSVLTGGAPDTFLGAGIQTCIKILNSKDLGEPVAATAFMVCPGHESWHPDPEFYYKKGGGPMFDMGPYYLTALVSMLGGIKTISAITKKTYEERIITSKEKNGQKIVVDVPTHVSGTMEFQNGQIATMITSFDVHSSTLPRIEIYCSKGTLYVPDPNTFGGPVGVRKSNDNEIKWIDVEEPFIKNSRGLGVADLARAIENDDQPRASGDMAYHVLEAMWGFHISSDTKTHYNMKTRCDKPKPLKTEIIIK